MLLENEADNARSHLSLVAITAPKKNPVQFVPASCYEHAQANEQERAAMQAANQMAVTTVQELALMKQRLEMQQLEKIRDICEAAMEDMETLPDKVGGVRVVAHLRATVSDQRRYGHRKNRKRHILS